MFLFYTSWKPYVEMMDCEETKRFVNNLINYTEGNEIELITQTDKLVWIGVQPLLDNNEQKRQRQIEKNKINGAKGGAPVGNSNAKKTTQNNPTVDKTTQNNQNQPKQPEEEERGRMKEDVDVDVDSRKKIVDVDSRKKIVDVDSRKKIVDVDSRKKIVEKLLRFNKQYIDEGYLTSEQVSNLILDDVRWMIHDILNDKFTTWESILISKGYNDFCFYLRDNKYEIDYVLDGLVKSYLIL
jgi:hypothetical protein